MHPAFLSRTLLAALALILVSCGGSGASETSSNSASNTSSSASSSVTTKNYGAAFYASPTATAGDGSQASPYSLEQARDAVRAKISTGAPAGGIIVWLRGGIYERSAALTLDSRDSGKDANNTVDWRAYPGETVQLVGGKKLKASDFKLMTSSSTLWNRLDSSAQGKVMQIDMKALGITDFGTLRYRGGWDNQMSALELSIGSKPMPLARWPDENAADDAANGIKSGFAMTNGGTSDATSASFIYQGNRPSRWAGRTDAWVEGYWQYLWGDFNREIKAIDTSAKRITLPDGAGYGVAAAPEQRPWFAYNLLEEITTPGEWYLDRSTGLLYVWPTADFASADILVSLMETPLVSIKGASHLTLQNITLEAARNVLLDAESDSNTNLIFSELTLRNSGSISAIISGKNNLLTRSTVTGSGGTAIFLKGGAAASLTAGNNRVENCEISHFARFARSYKAAVEISGVGNIVRNNHIHHAPHLALSYGGNDHLIELNDIHDVLLTSDDSGAIYAGRRWEWGGNVIRHNYLHDMRSAFGHDFISGVYLDDQLSGIRIEGNIFSNIKGNGILHGGGHDNVMVNNLFVGGDFVLWVDSRGSGYVDGVDPVGDREALKTRYMDSLRAANYQSTLWAGRYPAMTAIPNNLDSLDFTNGANADKRKWLSTYGSIFNGNIAWNHSKTSYTAVGWTADNYDAFGKASIESYASYSKATVADPQFVDAANPLKGVKTGSPAAALNIPFSKIGIQP